MGLFDPFMYLGRILAYCIGLLLGQHWAFYQAFLSLIHNDDTKQQGFIVVKSLKKKLYFDLWKLNNKLRTLKIYF